MEFIPLLEFDKKWKFEVKIGIKYPYLFNKFNVKLIEKLLFIS